MGFFDRFRPDPKWKHADPAMRMVSIPEIPDEEQELLASIATDDADARVRRAAVRRLVDPMLLARVARDDSDAGVKEEAADLLLQRATGPDASLAGRALDAIGDARHLAQVARTSTLESMARAALDRIGDADAKVLAIVARQSPFSAVRLSALGRITDQADLATVALKTEHKDVGLAAADRIEDSATLESVSTRARTKAVNRRARARLRERGAIVPPEPMEVAAVADDSPIAESAPPEIQRIETPPAPTEESIERDEAERVERERRAAEIQPAIAARDEISARVDAADAESALSSVQDARMAWDALPPASGPEIDAAARRFERACAEAEARHGRLLADRERHARLGALATEAEQLVAQPDIAPARGRWKALSAEWASLAGAGNVDAAVTERYVAAAGRYSERDAELREQRAREQRENLERLQRLAEEIGRLAAVPELSLKQATHAMQQARAAVEHPGWLPSRRDQDVITQQLRAAHAALQTRVQELKDADDWQRWANVTVQETLIKRLEALRDAADSADAARELRQVHEEWKKVSAVPKEKAQELWGRFKAAADAVHARADAWFAQQREERAGNLAKKEALCERAEALADSSDWLKTAEAIKALQAEWKTIGPGLRDKSTWERFRAACDRFFSRRHADLAQRKEAWGQNQQKKEALCARVEELATTASDWDAAAAEVRRIQVEWRAVGPVRRSRSDELWQRFVRAGERFQERYQQRDALAMQAKIAAREELAQEMEALAQADATGTPAELLSQVNALRARWQSAPAVPKEQLEASNQRFDAAFAALIDRRGTELRGTDLDIDANRRRMETLCARVEALASEGVPIESNVSPAALLATQLREALAANTIGGRVNEELKWKAAGDEVKEVQAAWRRIGAVPSDVGRQLTDRFQRACARFFEQQRRRAPAAPPARSAAGPSRRG